MPGGGLFSLVAFGSQNVLLSGNPQLTFFYKTYKKYTHFAEESVTRSVDGQQQLCYDKPVQIRYKIERLADLVRDMYFAFDLPDIYSKDISQNSIYTPCFEWIDYIGCNIIQNVAFYIGGQKIQEFDGSYMVALSQLDLYPSELIKWQSLVGHVPELINPSTGIYATGPNRDMYPSVYASTTNVNRPSIFGQTIQVPIPFWFTRSTFGALPLVALQYMECEVQITLRSIQELYRLRSQNIDMSEPIRDSDFVRPGFFLNETLDDIGIDPPLNPYYTQLSSISNVTIDNFLVDWGTPNPLLKTWNLNPRMVMTYVYLTDEERKEFSSRSLQYLVRQVTTYRFPNIIGRQLLELETHNPVTRLILIPRRSDSILNRNDYSNYTNWIDGTTAPISYPLGPVPPVPGPINQTGLLIPIGGQQPIIQCLRVLGDGNELQEEKPVSYFDYIVPWKYVNGLSSTGILMYPFSLTSPDDQPNGSINTSRIRLFQVDVNTYPLLGPTINNPMGSFYAYDIVIYVESLNWVNISSGTGGLNYAL